MRGCLTLEAAHKMLQVFVNGSIDLVIAQSSFLNTGSKTQCDVEQTLHDDNWDRSSEIPTGLENGIILQRFQKMRHDGQLSRRSSLNKALSLTPLQHSTEYTPVYGNRVTNTMNDDLKKNTIGNSIHVDDNSKEINDKILNDSMYALLYARPSSCTLDCSKFEDRATFAKSQARDNELHATSSFGNQIDSEVKQKAGPVESSRTPIIDIGAVDGKEI